MSQTFVKKQNVMKATDFLAHLAADVRRLQQTTEHEFMPLELALLNHKPTPTGWSILECLEHLNRYSRYYLPQLAKAISRATSATGAPDAEPVGYSWLGRKFVDMMQPTNQRRHTTLKHMNPHGSQLGRDGLVEFLQHQTQLLDFLAQAQQADLNRRAVPVEFFKLLKMRLGEALEFIVVHEQRHIQQAQRVKASLRATLTV
jgi:uncharacterized damage-inducible protein DinB